MLRGGAIVPHAPLVALKGDPSCIALAEAARAAWKEISQLGCPVVVLSPHGRATGVSSSGEGNLDAFGSLGISVSATVDRELAQRIADAWGRPLVDEPLDHGATGALVHAEDPGSIVTCTFAESTGPSPRGSIDEARKEANGLAEVLIELSENLDIAVVASVHGAASVTPRAPLTELPEGRAFDDAVLDALATDNAAIADIADDLFRVGGTCSTGPLHVWALLFGDRSSNVHAYDAPAGVGYPIATCK
ncbi:MAG: hypothetical protein ACR2KQ_11175 [Actinomycetota bacterium]